MKKTIKKFHPHIIALLRGFFTFVTLSAVMALFPAMAYCEPVTLAWDANQESDLKGYILYYGTASTNYSSDIDVGDVTQYTIPDLQDGVTYYFAVKAYNDADFKSDYSEELAYTVGVPNTFPNTPAAPNSPSSGYIYASYTFNTSTTDPDGDPLEYQFDWGDGTQSAWGAASRSHAWSTAGTFCIKARARDIYGAFSGWSDCHNITIAIATYSITVTAGANGSISPTGTVTVDHGSDVTFTIKADPNYRVLAVSVDGSSQGAVTSYTFNNVTEDHTITASFGRNRSPIAEAGPDQTVYEGATVTLDASSSYDPDDDVVSYLWEQTTGPSVTLISSLRSDEFDDGSTAGFWNWDPGIDGAHREQNNYHEIDSSSASVWANFDPAWLYQTVSADEDFDVYAKLEVPAINANYQKAGLAFRAIGQNSHVQIIRLRGQQVESGHTINGSVDSVLDDVTATTLWLRIRREGSNLETYYATISPESETDWTLIEPSNTWSYSGSGQVGIFASDSGGGQFTAKFHYFKNWLGNPITTSITSQPSFIAPAVGPNGASLTFQLTVTDDGGSQSTGTCIVNVINVNNGNSSPVSHAGDDQTVEEGETVLLSGLNSSDPDDNIVAYTWQQTGGKSVTFSNSNVAETSFIAPNVTADSETLTFQLTIQDTDGMKDVDTCVVTVTRAAQVDSDGDGVPDDQDDFPFDADEHLDSDGDGEGNNADTDDDNDGMPDDWELTYGLNPLEDDAGDDPDGDDVSNINEYNSGSAPNHAEGNFKPEAPVLVSPENGASVTLNPLLQTGDFDDPNVNDEHSKTQWVVMRAFDDVCVFDVTTDASLTSLDMPKHVLEEDTEYLWKARFIDNHSTPSEWSEEREFVSGIADHDSDKNGVPDVQEIDETVDLDEDGTVDIVQTDIKCVSFQEGIKPAHICISIKGAQNAESIVSMEVQDPADPELNSATNGKPNYFEFGLLDFKILVRNPGDETTVTIYLSKSAFEKGNCFKYDPVNKTWLDYSGYTEFSPNRKIVFLTLKDGGFGDADGIENGIIVDPLAFGSETDPSGSGSDSVVEEVVDGIMPDELSCFISAAAPPYAYTSIPGLSARFSRPRIVDSDCCHAVGFYSRRHYSKPKIEIRLISNEIIITSIPPQKKLNPKEGKFLLRIRFWEV